MFSKLNKSGISISDRQPHKCLLSVSEPFPLPLLNICLLVVPQFPSSVTFSSFSSQVPDCILHSATMSFWTI